jgi:hypothetical protein
MRKQVERCGHTHRDQHSGGETNVVLEKSLRVAVNVNSGFPLAEREEHLFYGTNISFLIELLTFSFSVLVLATTEKNARRSEPRASAQMFPHETLPHKIKCYR